jgi:hypothetical protein
MTRAALIKWLGMCGHHVTAVCVCPRARHMIKCVSNLRRFVSFQMTPYVCATCGNMFSETQVSSSGFIVRARMWCIQRRAEHIDDSDHGSSPATVDTRLSTEDRHWGDPLMRSLHRQGGCSIHVHTSSVTLVAKQKIAFLIKST